MIRYFALSILCLFGLIPLFATGQTEGKEPKDQSTETVKQQKESLEKNRRQKKDTDKPRRRENDRRRQQEMKGGENDRRWPELRERELSMELENRERQHQQQLEKQDREMQMELERQELEHRLQLERRQQEHDLDMEGMGRDHRRQMDRPDLHHFDVGINFEWIHDELSPEDREKMRLIRFRLEQNKIQKMAEIRIKEIDIQIALQQAFFSTIGLSSVEETVKAIATLKGELQILEIKAMLEVKNLLNPEQLQVLRHQFERRQDEHNENRQERRDEDH